MKISIIIPVYNEAQNIPILYQELKNALKHWEFEQEIIFVNDGSSDSSQIELNKLAQTDPAVKIIEFTRNFGKEMAITAGLNQCQGNAAIMLDADLQHPVALIPEFIEKWIAGAELVIGVRNKNKRANIFKTFPSWLFYKIINLISETKVLPRSTDFRLLDRQVIDEFNRLTEKARMSRALINWLGFKPEYIYFDAPPRKKGKAGYSGIKLVKLALSSFVGMSLFPLKFAGYLGILITFFSGLLGLFIFIENYILNDPLDMNFSGPAILGVITLFLVGIILSCLGLIALYIANIQAQVINRPMYVIRKTNNSL